MTKPVFKAVFESDDGRWLVRVPAVPGAHSHGHTLACAPANIKEALGLILDTDEETFELEE